MGFVLTQAVRAVYGETHEDDVSVWIGERSQPVIVLLTCCVPESQLHLTNTTDGEAGGKQKSGRNGETGRRRGRAKKLMEVNKPQ